MQTVSIPWRAYYDQENLDLTFPDAWDIAVSNMKGGSDIGDVGIREAFANPIGSQPLREIAQGKRSAAIIVDDLSRPTPAHRLLPYIFEELEAAGIGVSQTKIIGAVAAHRAMVRDDFIKKVGQDIVDRYYVTNHDAYGTLDFLGHSSRGIPIYVNRDFMSSDVRIALGMITPRGGFFGGGAKLVLPGVCGHVTITANHRYVHDGFREHLDEVGQMVGLSFLVNPLLNPDLEITGMVTGNHGDAYWQGVEMGKDLYSSPFPEDLDVAIFNAFPKDTEFMQAGMAMVALRSGKHSHKIKDNGTVVIISASPEGLGWHSVFGPLGSLSSGKASSPSSWRTIMLSPGVNKWDVLAKHGDSVIHTGTWDETLAELQKIHGESARVGVFPCGAMQYAP
jgi:nickel-dependent lactate racemase